MVIEFRCFEGVHGVGKTTMINRFKAAGFPVIEENFLGFNLPDKRATTNIINEMATIVAWFERIFKFAEEHPEWEQDHHCAHVVYVDRSMLSPVAYMGSITSCGDDRETHRSASFLLHAIRSILVQACTSYNVMFHIVSFEPSRGDEQILSQIHKRAETLNVRDRELRMNVLKEDDIRHIKHVIHVLEHAYFLMINWSLSEPQLRNRIFISKYTVNYEQSLKTLSVNALHENFWKLRPKYRFPMSIGTDGSDRYRFQDEYFVSVMSQHDPEVADLLHERLTSVNPVETEDDFVGPDCQSPVR